ncbi:lipopolysaccharide biosynthesis protein [Mucilaginibacter sabulilitoris]|uniref:Lipopolysaccharide biosynthesis protein n=1 Tax=Mucilaginibacter sabulilitoris TaxID=1173583 RepID=A0ABZ0TXD0_9SPHI|nr:lipopolysaccharide biosynthesis protein [Mucilaginibacter sabulilitoris]WPU95785.1 lipopolysaccharide biosynthesis protein [Mucilaginibacter sabulilitoris]
MGQASDEKINADNEQLSLKDLILKIGKWWQYLLSKWVTILIAGIIGGAIGLTYAYLKKPIYKAELSFALDDDKSSSGGFGSALGLASQFGIDLGGGNGGGAFSGDNLLALMKSRSMTEKALLSTITLNGKQETLVEYYISFNKIRKTWQPSQKLKNIVFLPNADRSKFSLQQDSILGAFYHAISKSHLTVDKADKKLTIISVKVSSENELFAKYFTEILVKTVSNFYVETKTKKSVQNVNILQRQTDSVRRELNAAINGVASSSDLNPNPNPALQILRAPAMRRQVDVQANQAILTQLVANLEISKVSLRKETPLIQIIDRPILPLEKEALGKVQGLIIGGFLGSLLLIIFISARKFFKILLS